MYLTQTSGKPSFVRFSDNLFTRYPLLSAVLGQTISETQATGYMAGQHSPNWSKIFFRRSVVTIKR